MIELGQPFAKNTKSLQRTLLWNHQGCLRGNYNKLDSKLTNLKKYSFVLVATTALNSVAHLCSIHTSMIELGQPFAKKSIALQRTLLTGPELKWRVTEEYAAKNRF